MSNEENLILDWREAFRRNAVLSIRGSSAYNVYLFNQIYNYYEERGLRWPSFEEARELAKTEEGEVSEQWLAGKTSEWIRNNPESHEPYSANRMLEELADQVFMLLVAGMVMGSNLLDVMSSKMDRKMKEHREKIHGSE